MNRVKAKFFLGNAKFKPIPGNKIPKMRLMCIHVEEKKEEMR
jgi:hypothetical protein